MEEKDIKEDDERKAFRKKMRIRGEEARRQIFNKATDVMKKSKGYNHNNDEKDMTK